jgi:penicillin V acylase-like amidase (Ntn superfamily)
MKRIASFSIIGFLYLCAGLTAFPCTTFVMQDKGRVYFGRNLDWDWENGWVVVNPRNVQKTALVAPGNPPAKWTSKFGSVTFNQFGDEMPFGGMNEAGLVIENMMLDDTRYPAPDARPEIGMLQWIQYQLDTCSNVAEVVATDAKVRLEQPTVPAAIHYLVCDAAGNCATIEFLDGKMVCHQGQALPYHALANDTYDKSAAYARTNPMPARRADRLKDPHSLARFTCAADRAAAFKPSTPEKDVAYAFATLEQVRQGTVWQMVYDIPGRRIHFRTQSNPRERSVDLKSLDFAHARAVKFVDIQANPSSSGALEFADLTEAQHRKYLQSFFALESLKRSMGDLMPRIEPSLFVLRSYTYAGEKP